jgi:hypothetical protein
MRRRLQGLQGRQVQLVHQPTRKLRADAWDRAEEPLRLGFALHAIELRPATRQHELGQGACDPRTDARQGVQTLSPLSREDRRDWPGKSFHHIGRLSIRARAEGVGGLILEDGRLLSQAARKETAFVNSPQPDGGPARSQRS